MPDVLAITGPIFLAALLGYATTRAGLFAKADMRMFGKFVVNIALPALLFNALSQRPIGDVLNGGYLLAYLAGSLALLGAGYAWGHRVAKLDPAGCSIVAMGMTCANSGFIGYPILLLTLPSVAGVVLALNMMVENLVVIPLVLLLAERGQGGEGRWHAVVGKSLERLAANPLLIAIAGGIAMSALGWRLPAAVARTVDLFALSCSALSLFVIGGTLVALPMRGLGSKVVPIAVGKLILHPLAVGLAVLALPALGMPALDPALRAAAVLTAAVPMMGIYPIFAQAYGHEDLGAASMLVATVASFFTLSGLLWMFANHPGVF
jgi:predicted permease